MVIAVIPVRHESTRFPGKPLHPLLGKTLVRWVYEGACQASSLDEVLVATDDARIREVVEGFGAPCVMTGSTPRNGTERVAEAMAGREADVVVNVQGDEALITGAQIDAAVAALERDPQAAMATLAAPLAAERLDDPGAVKVVVDGQGRALAFSRSRAPLPSRPDLAPMLHAGVYAFRREALDAYPGLAPTDDERRERLEQLRLLGHGLPVAVAVVQAELGGVDSPESVPAVEALLRERQHRS